MIIENKTKVQSHANQKFIHIQKEEAFDENYDPEHPENYDEDKLYAKMNVKALEYACTVLDPSSLKLYLYMNSHQDQYKFWLSKYDAVRFGICSKSAYDRAVATLIKEGFLVEVEHNSYNFYEIPKEPKIMITVIKQPANERIQK